MASLESPSFMQADPSSNTIVGKPAHGRNVIFVQCKLNTRTLLDNLYTLYYLIFTTHLVSESSSSY